MGCMSTEVKQDPAVGRARNECPDRHAGPGSGRAKFRLEPEAHRAVLADLRGAAQNALGEATRTPSAATINGTNTSVFQPIENKMAEDAMNYDSPEEVARREPGRRHGGSAVRQHRRRPAGNGAHGRVATSSLGATAMTDQANARALASAGAINKERNDTKILGMSLRENAAKFGRNQTGTALLRLRRRCRAELGGRDHGLTVGAGECRWYGAGVAGDGHGRDQLHGQYGPEPDADAAERELGQPSRPWFAVGDGMMAGAMMFASSKELKEDGHPLTTTQRWPASRKSPLSAGSTARRGGRRRHVGPAEDMQAQFGDQVAPGGIGLDMVSVSGQHHAAIRALAKVDRLERRPAGGARAGHRIGAHPHAEQGRAARCRRRCRRSVGGTDWTGEDLMAMNGSFAGGLADGLRNGMAIAQAYDLSKERRRQREVDESWPRCN